MRWGAGVGIVAIALLASTMANANASKSMYAFVGVHVVPMDEERVLESQTVLVFEDRIKEIGPVGEVDVPDEAVIIDGEGLYLMPGLAEMHAHIPSSRSPADYRENTLFLYVANGITTIRGMLGEPSHLELRAQSAAGEILAPRIYTSGPSLNILIKLMTMVSVVFAGLIVAYSLAG